MVSIPLSLLPLTYNHQKYMRLGENGALQWLLYGIHTEALRIVVGMRAGLQTHNLCLYPFA